MKLYKSFLVVTALAGAMLTSCSDSGYWDEATSADLGNGKTYSFNNSTLQYEFPASESLVGQDVEVLITRGTTEGEETIEVISLFSDDEAMSGPETVTFANGSNTAVYPIHFTKDINPGEKLQAMLVIDPIQLGIDTVAVPADLPENATPEDSAKYEADMEAYEIAYETYENRLKNYKLSTTITVTKLMTWSECGKCMFVDYTASDGTTAEDVTILHADGTNIYRIVNPWTAVYGDDATGTDIEFTLDENYQMTLETDGTSTGIVAEFTYDGDSYTFCMPTKYLSYCSVVSQGNIYQASMLGLYNGEGYYQGFQFAFMWTEGWPGDE